MYMEAPLSKIDVQDTPGKGRGVFFLENVKKWAFMIEYEASIYARKETTNHEEYETNERGCYNLYDNKWRMQTVQQRWRKYQRHLRKRFVGCKVYGLDVYYFSSAFYVSAAASRCERKYRWCGLRSRIGGL